MIKPTSLWNFIHECELGDAEYIGRICLALAGKPDIPFTRAEKIQFLAIRKDNLDMDERIEESRERDRKRKAEARARRNTECPTVSAGIPRNPTESHGQTWKDEDSAAAGILPPSVPPSVRPSILPKETNKSLSFSLGSVGKNAAETVPQPSNATDRNENDNEKKIFREKVEAARKNETARFMSALRKSGEEVFFSGEFDVSTICAAITDDSKSMRRWRQMANLKGEAQVLECCFTLYREMKAGEIPDNPGAVLNSRLAALPDIPT